MNQSFLEFYNEQDDGVLHPAYTFANKVIKLLKSDNAENYDRTAEGIELKGIAPRILITTLGSQLGLDNYKKTIFLPIITETQFGFNIRILSVFFYRMAIQKFKKESILRDWLVNVYEEYYEGNGLNEEAIERIPQNINWTKVNTYMKKLGYDVRGAVDVQKTVTMNPRLLNHEDWKKAIEYGSTIRTQKEDPFRKAKRYFGLTTNFNEVGYILPDGKLLDFSLKNQGGTPGKRIEDHNSLAGFIDDDSIDNKYDIVKSMGVIRAFPEIGGLHFGSMPTSAQQKTASQFLNYHRLDKDDIRYIDVVSDKSKQTLEYPGKTSPIKILQDVIDFYSN